MTDLEMTKLCADAMGLRIVYPDDAALPLAIESLRMHSEDAETASHGRLMLGTDPSTECNKVNEQPFSDVECYELLKLVKQSGFNPEPHFDQRSLKAVIFYLGNYIDDLPR